MTGTREAPSAPVLEALARTSRLLVCCDFDGTLSHLVEHPSAARPVPGAVEVLDALGTLPRTTAAVLSGRNLTSLVGVAAMPEHVVLVGSHGTEYAPGVISDLGPEQRSLLDDLVDACEAIVASVPGGFVEVKPASVAVHVRNVSQELAPEVLEAVRSGPATRPTVQVTEGKSVIELAVVRGGKGAALDTLRERTRASATVFIGDDVTDEDAFRALRVGDVGVKVGEGPTAARWRVHDPIQVVDLLEEVLAARRVVVDSPR
jgi:trehalose 6-phosphate phosphatase